mgnify:CR=1 FL=1
MGRGSEQLAQHGVRIQRAQAPQQALVPGLRLGAPGVGGGFAAQRQGQVGAGLRQWRQHFAVDPVPGGLPGPHIALLGGCAQAFQLDHFVGGRGRVRCRQAACTVHPGAGWI